MSAARWERLRADLAAAGIETKISERAYADLVYGRVEHGVTRHIYIGSGAGSIDIADRWGRGGKWYGWTVSVAYGERGEYDREVVRGATRRSKVVRAVLAARNEEIGDRR